MHACQSSIGNDSTRQVMMLTWLFLDLVLKAVEAEQRNSDLIAENMAGLLSSSGAFSSPLGNPSQSKPRSQPNPQQHLYPDTANAPRAEKKEIDNAIADWFLNVDDPD